MLFQSGVVAFCATIASLSSFTTALPAKESKVKPAAFFLAGDSTTAVQSTGGGGKSIFPMTMYKSGFSQRDLQAGVTAS